jgi:hypothetical protein
MFTYALQTCKWRNIYAKSIRNLYIIPSARVFSAPQTGGQMFKQKINTRVELVEWSHWIPNDHARLSWMFDTVSHTWTDTWEKSGVQQSPRSAFPTSVLRSASTYVSRHNLHSNLSEALTTAHDVIKPLRSCSVSSFRLLASGLLPQRP